MCVFASVASMDCKRSSAFATRGCGLQVGLPFPQGVARLWC
jgi:hypothetical protein